MPSKDQKGLPLSIVHTRNVAVRSVRSATQEEQWDHCFKCGQSSHLSRGCRAQRKDRTAPIDLSANTVTTQPQTLLLQPKQSNQRDVHKFITDSIQYLGEKVAADVQEREKAAMSINLLSPHQKAQLLHLIGKKHMIICRFDGLETKALWDTGSQVCLIKEMETTKHSICKGEKSV